jgi:hypothetical protein
MTTGQKYVGKANYANANESAAKNATQAVENAVDQLNYHQVALFWVPYGQDGEKLVPPIDSTIFQRNAFIDRTLDIKYVNEVREALRSWFCCYIPEEVQCQVHGPGEERGLELYQDLDQFLSNLIDGAVDHYAAKLEAERMEAEKKQNIHLAVYNDLKASGASPDVLAATARQFGIESLLE